MNHVEALRWSEDQLCLLDQRALPQEIRYIDCRSAAEVADAIRDMVVRGAPAIGCAAAYGIAMEAARNPTGLDAAFLRLAASRPTAVNLDWALARMRRLLPTHGDVDAAALLREAQAIHAEDIRINRAIGSHGAARVPQGACIMTHCNAGALATAGHGTALGVIRSARDVGKNVRVYANETRPYLQGARLTAWELMQENIPVTLVTDNMAGHLMQRGQIDWIVVGADRVAANGDVANKIGTYTLAVLAERHRIPFYVAVPRSTFDMRLSDGSQIPIEERSGAEVTGYGGLQWAPEGVRVEYPAFDVTPHELITGLITEDGIIDHPDTEKLRAFFSR
ncbi:MAG TPA: S-methyl-5-thioribose-1-phosphate isomerase [Burkholderiales bacterium]|nr:S-methyl-5-thioribose-1-phosphate isomerase [Burkholderiales bacterium]